MLKQICCIMNPEEFINSPKGAPNIKGGPPLGAPVGTLEGAPLGALEGALLGALEGAPL